MIYDIIEQLGATSKRKEKEEILQNLNEQQSDLFRWVGNLCYGVDHVFGLKVNNIPKVELTEGFTPTITLETFLEFLDEKGLSGGFRSDEQRTELFLMMDQLSPQDREVVRLIFKGNLGCGVSASTINKVWPDTIFVPPYQRCDSLNKKNFEKLGEGPYQGEVKMDGKFTNIIFDPDNESIEFRSREWGDNTARYMTTDRHDLHRVMCGIYPEGVVLHGEAVALDEKKENMLPREESNGYLNRDEIDPSRVVFVVWDMIPLIDFYNNECLLPQDFRFSQLCETVENVDYMEESGFQIIISRLLSDRDEIKEYFIDARKNGYEGIILKDRMGTWKHGTSKKQLKAKVVVDCDLKLTGYTLSEETKYAGMIAALEVESSCGGMKCRLGSGLTDELRGSVSYIEELIENGAIVKARYNDVVENEDIPDKKALYLGRFVEFRDDKSEADTLERIEAQLDEAKLDF